MSFVLIFDFKLSKPLLDCLLLLLKFSLSVRFLLVVHHSDFFPLLRLHLSLFLSSFLLLLAPVFELLKLLLCKPVLLVKLETLLSQKLLFFFPGLFDHLFFQLPLCLGLLLGFESLLLEDLLSLQVTLFHLYTPFFDLSSLLSRDSLRLLNESLMGQLPLPLLLFDLLSSLSFLLRLLLFGLLIFQLSHLPGLFSFILLVLCDLPPALFLLGRLFLSGKGSLLLRKLPLLLTVLFLQSLFCVSLSNFLPLYFLLNRFLDF